MINDKYFNSVKNIILFMLLSLNIFGQGIGNNLAFQGVMQSNFTGVKPVAMGNAYTAITGDINAIFYNPAGLATIKDLQISFSARSDYYKTFERQQFIPVGGSYGIMELIWAGIYTPQLKDDGIRSDKIKYDLENDFTKPDSAVEYFDEKNADWVKNSRSSGLNNIIIAYPFNAFNLKFVASASYSNSSIFDFDRNEHVLGTDYGPGRIIADSNWYVYNRKRTGNNSSFLFALGTEVSGNLDVGLSLEYFSSKTDDNLSREIFAHFQIQQEQNLNRQLPTNTYYFWHDSLTTSNEGKSDFSSFKIGLGVIYKTERISFGIKVNLPYSLTRTYSYKKFEIKKFLRDTLAAPVKKEIGEITGEDTFEAPFSFGLGFTIKPVDFIKFAIDYQIKPFSKGQYKFTREDPTFSKWAFPNLNSFSLGIELMPYDFISLLAGYSFQDVPLRAEDHFKGEKIGKTANILSLGLSLLYSHVQFDLAYQWTYFKYIDYYSYHTDYINWDAKKLLINMNLML